MKKIFIFFLILSTTVLAQTAGKSGLSFLKFGFGARNIAMGDAGSVTASDVTSLFYNPANLSVNDNTEIVLMHYEWIQDVSSEILGVKFEAFGLPLAAGFNVTTAGDIPVRSKASDEPESTFDANYFFGSLSTGFNIVEDIAFGATIRYMYEGYLSDEATGLGFDFGLRYVTPVKGLTASAVIKNLGSMNQLREVETELPTELRIGGLYQFDFDASKFDLNVAAEMHKYTKTDDTHFNIGSEIVYDNIIALRAGYQSGYESRDFTGGIGLMWGRLKFDYAFMPMSQELGSGNLFSLQFMF
ncbi:MAG: PorV/PorQ family protein [Ignavibacteriaceae bacterium]